jgi:hypothetical protein
MECGVWSVEYGVWSMECGVWSVEYGVWSVEYGVWSVEYGVYLTYSRLNILTIYYSTIGNNINIKIKGGNHSV